MNLTLSPQIRIVALVGLVAVVALGGATMVLGRSHPSAATTTPAHHGSVQVPTVPKTTTVAKTSTVAKTGTVPKPSPAQTTTGATPATTKHAAPTATTKAPAKTSTPSAATTATKTSSKAATKTAAKHAAPVRRGNLVYSDLPQPLQWQLSQHKVVVVSVYDPRVDADAISVAEAHAGALDANTGFLLVSVLDNKVAGILTALLPGGGLLPVPGVLVYRAPGNLALRIDGFADRQSVAQAATNVLAGQATTIAR
jgi:hypothetical protein